MKLAGVRAEDIVRCDHLGRCFWARVIKREDSKLRIEPLSRNVTYYRVSGREVRERYARRRRVSARAVRAGDLIEYQEHGETVLAVVSARLRGRLRVLPLDLRVGIRELHIREMTGHYARRGLRRAASGT
jgi:hypothetical protein